MLVPRSIPNKPIPAVANSNEGGPVISSYAQAFQQKKLENIQLELHKKQIEEKLKANKVLDQQRGRKMELRPPKPLQNLGLKPSDDQTSFSSSMVGSTISRVQRNSSLSKLKAINEKNSMGALSREEEEQAAREKKERLDEIKKKYNKLGKQARTRSNNSARRLVSAKVEAQSAVTELQQ